MRCPLTPSRAAAAAAVIQAVFKARQAVHTPQVHPNLRQSVTRSRAPDKQPFCMSTTWQAPRCTGGS